MYSKPVPVLHVQRAKKNFSERADGSPINLFTHTVVHALGSAMVAKEW